MKLEIVTPDRDILGESAVWSARDAALFWVDIRRRLLRRLHPASGALSDWSLSEPPGSVAIRAQGGVILALTSGLSAFCPAGNQLQLLTAAPHDTATQRFNDGRCDPRGRFWVGSMPASERVPTGALYRFDADLSAHEVMTGLTIPNSLAWNLDGTTMFFADTLRATICAYDYQLETGEIGPERVFASTAERRGRPDGATVDEEGFLWSAEFDGWCLTRYGPDGNVDRHVPLPVQCPTSCAFGGVKLDTLYVTTARHRLTETEQQHQPLAGALLALDVGVRGRIEPEFAG